MPARGHAKKSRRSREIRRNCRLILGENTAIAKVSHRARFRRFLACWCRLVEGNKPFQRTDAEQAAVDVFKLPKVAAQVRLLTLLQVLDFEEAATVVCVEPVRLRESVCGDIEGWTVAEADDAFDVPAAHRRSGPMP